MPRKFIAKKKGAKKMARRGGRRGGHMYKSVSDIASCSVTRTLTPANANQIYSFTTISLADYTRAVSIAQNYQRFRITGVTVTWKPVYDTYALPAAAGYQKPNLYYVVDKTGSIPDNVTLEALKQSGAKVRALDEKPVSVRWRPSVLEENQAGGGGGFSGPSGYRTSPWLSTNQQATNPLAWTPNIANHLGLKFYIEQAGNGGAQVATPFPMDIMVEFQFIKPMISLVTSGSVGTLQYAKIDESPDGVEGGSDGISASFGTLTIS